MQQAPVLRRLLKRRGFNIFKEGPQEGAFIPRTPALVDEFYQLMGHYAFRLLLRDVLKQQGPFGLDEVTRYATAGVTDEYLEFLQMAGLVERTPEGFRRLRPEINTFGDTLEWYVAEVLRRELDMQCLWGVSFKGTLSGGDYDVLAEMDGALVYIEVKSSPPRQVYDKDVLAFLRRVRELCPELAVFLVDTHLRMKDKIVVLFEEALVKLKRSRAVQRLHNETFYIHPVIYITNSKPSISSNLQFIISHYYRRLCDD